MQGIVLAIRKIFGPKADAGLPAQQVIAPSEQLKHIQQNIKAITSTIDDSQAIVLHETFDNGGVLTDVEIRADRIHLSPAGDRPSKLVRLDDSLQSYREMDEELRVQLARKIARLVPTLAHSKKKLLLEHTVQVLKVMATDQTERVRMMVAEELAELPEAPYEVVRELACDPSLRVSRSILEFSPLLRDEDLIDIISTSAVPGVVESIARRKSVSLRVSDAIVNTHQPVAIHQLLSNSGSSISTNALQIITDEAEAHEIWHEPLSHRPELTQKTANRIAGFMSQQLLGDMEQKGALKLVHKQETQAAVQTRLNSWTADQERAAELRVRQLHEAGRLTEEKIGDAIDEVNEPFVAAALAILSGIPRETVKRILHSQSGRVITALAWEARLSMRTAIALQMKIGRVHHAKMVNAKGGTDYPLDEGEMQTYLEIFTG